MTSTRSMFPVIDTGILLVLNQGVGPVRSFRGPLQILACSFASLALAFLRLVEPFCLRDRLLDNRLRRASNAVCALGPGMISPVESVASADTPKSTPTAPWFSAWGRCELSGVSTVMLTNQRSATRETVADMSLPAKRNGSRIRTHPRWGM